MTARTIFTHEDCGCYADGTHGDAYVKQRSIDLAQDNGWAPDGIDDPDPDFMDDFADAALEHLNTLCEEGISFQLIDGDLVLISDSEVK